MEDEIKKLVSEVLRDGFVINLATNDKDGPWAASLVYVFDEEFNIYWISVPSSRHSRAIEKDKKVACAIVAEYATDKERALQIEGIAAPFPKTPFELEKKLQKKRGMSMPEKAGVSLKNKYQWYRLQPTRIELMYNERFGYERKSLLLN